MHRIALFLFLLPAWTWAQPELPSTSAQQLALGAYRTGFAALPDSTRAGKLYQRWHQHWAGRLDQNHSASTLLEAYQNPPPTSSELNWTYAGPGVVDVQRQGRVECLATPRATSSGPRRRALAQHHRRRLVRRRVGLHLAGLCPERPQSGVRRHDGFHHRRGQQRGHRARLRFGHLYLHRRWRNLEWTRPIASSPHAFCSIPPIPCACMLRSTTGYSTPPTAGTVGKPCSTT